MSSNQSSNSQQGNASGSSGGEGGGGGGGSFMKAFVDDPIAMTEGMKDLRRQGREDASAQEIIDHSFDNIKAYNGDGSGQRK